MLDCVGEVLDDEVVHLLHGSAGIVGEVNFLEGNLRNAGSVFLGYELECGNEHQIGVRAECMRLCDHVNGFLVSDVVAEAAEEGVGICHHVVRSTVADVRVTVVGVTGSILAADAEPVVTGVGDEGIGAFNVVAEHHHEELPVVGIGVHLDGLADVGDHTVECSLCTGGYRSVGFLHLRGKHGAALGLDISEVVAGGYCQKTCDDGN